MQGVPVKAKCPTCARSIIYSTDNPFRPFCSERCKMADLGKWIEGTYVIEGDDVDAIENALTRDVSDNQQ
jgi:uncharacterized protein